MLASLIFSVFLVGFKLTATKEIVLIIGRRKELRGNLALILPHVENEDQLVWIDDAMCDRMARADRIDELEAESNLSYSLEETSAVNMCQDMFAVFEGNDADTTHLERKASIKRAETKHDKATNLLLGYAEAEIRANPLDIVAYWLNADSRHLQSSNAANINCVRFECLERVNGHHSVSFIRFRGRGVQDRTFLNSFVAKQVAENPPTYVVAVVPIPSHIKVTKKDEAGAVRAENIRSFRCTAVAPGVTRLSCMHLICPTICLKSAIRCISSCMQMFVL